jgi:hypothetical protein
MMRLCRLCKYIMRAVTVNHFSFHTLDVDGLFVDIKVADGTICIDVKVRGGGGLGVRSYRSFNFWRKPSCKTSSSSREKFVLAVKKLKQPIDCNSLYNILLHKRQIYIIEQLRKKLHKHNLLHKLTTVKRLSLSMSTRANKNSMAMAIRRTQYMNTFCSRKFSTNDCIRTLYFNIYCQSHISNLLYLYNGLGCLCNTYSMEQSPS